MPTSAAAMINRDEVAKHQSKTSMWAVVDDKWVLDVTEFIPNHPGGAKILSGGLGKKFSFSHGSNAHFGHTANVFREACKAFESQPAPSPMEISFDRSRANGGLTGSGASTGKQPTKPVGSVMLLGMLAPAKQR